MGHAAESQFSTQFSVHDADAAPAGGVSGLHIGSTRLYEDFYTVTNAGTSTARYLDIIAEARRIANAPLHHSEAVVLAALRRKATAHLFLAQSKRALATAELMIRMRFDWPYGHLVKADALLALGQYTAASNTYQLAEQLMPRLDPTDDFGRPEVGAQIQALYDHLAAKSCLTITPAHDCEVTAMASWPVVGTGRKRMSSGHRRTAPSAHDLQLRVNSAVNNALEAISRDGAMSHVQLHAVGTRRASTPAVPTHADAGTGATTGAAAASIASTAQVPGSPTWGLLEGSAGASTTGDTLDQLLAHQMQRDLAASVAAQRATGAPTSNSDGGHRSAGANGAYLTMLDTAVSSNSDCNALRTTTSELEFRTQTSTLHACSYPSPALALEQDLDAAGGDASGRAVGDNAAASGGTLPSLLRHTQATQQQATQMASMHNSMLSSEAVSSGSLPWSSARLADFMASGAPPQFLVTGDLSGGLRLWDAARFEYANDLPGHSAGITALAFAKDLRKGHVLLLASGDAEGVVIVWALEPDGSIIESRRLNGHSNRVVAIKFVSAGRRLVSASVDTHVAVWHVSSGAEEARLAGHRRAVTAMDCLTVHGVVAVATCSANGWWGLWDLDRKRREFAGHAAGAAGMLRFSPALAALTPPRPLLVTAHWDAGGKRGEASVHLWDVLAPGAAAGAPDGVLAPAGVFPGVARKRVTDVAFSNDAAGKALMAVAAADGTLLIVDLAAHSILTHLADAHPTVDGVLLGCVCHCASDELVPCNASAAMA